jgi:hypothetical protein
VGANSAWGDGAGTGTEYAAESIAGEASSLFYYWSYPQSYPQKSNAALLLLEVKGANYINRTKPREFNALHSNDEAKAPKDKTPTLGRGI